MIYAFEDIDPSLDLVPLAARRALDGAGLKVSLAAWRRVPLAARQALVEAGAAASVDVAKVARVLSRSRTSTEAVAKLREPGTQRAPASVLRALGHDVSASTWQALSPLERYVLVKIAAKGRADRMARAYNEIVLVPEPREPRSISTHLSKSGEVHMVDVGDKATTSRRALAEARVTMDPATATRLREGRAGKGDVLATARIAGIQAAKRTPDLIPLCHVVALTRVRVDLSIEEGSVTIRAAAEARDRTGVEMEAMVAASTAALTIYDMLKGVDRGMSFEVMLLEKTGGKTGAWRR